MRAIVALLVVACATEAQAEDPDVDVSARRRHAVSINVLSLDANAVALEYEHQVLDRVSVAAAAGVRDTVAGDYSGRTIALGSEGRVWWIGRALGSALPAKSMIGPFSGVRIDLARGWLREGQGGRTLAGSTTASLTGTIGYRFALWSRLEVTPSAGIGVRTEWDHSGRLAPWTRLALDVGLTAGVMF